MTIGSFSLREQFSERGLTDLIFFLSISVSLHFPFIFFFFSLLTESDKDGINKTLTTNCKYYFVVKETPRAFRRS